MVDSETPWLESAFIGQGAIALKRVRRKATDAGAKVELPSAMSVTENMWGSCSVPTPRLRSEY